MTKHTYMASRHRGTAVLVKADIEEILEKIDPRFKEYMADPGFTNGYVDEIIDIPLSNELSATFLYTIGVEKGETIPKLIRAMVAVWGDRKISPEDREIALDELIGALGLEERDSELRHIKELVRYTIQQAHTIPIGVDPRTGKGSPSGVYSPL